MLRWAIAHSLTRMPSMHEVVRSHSSRPQSGSDQSGSVRSGSETSGTVHSGRSGHSSSGKWRRSRLRKKKRSGTDGHGAKCGNSVSYSPSRSRGSASAPNAI